MEKIHIISEFRIDVYFFQFQIISNPEMKIEMEKIHINSEFRIGMYFFHFNLQHWNVLQSV